MIKKIFTLIIAVLVLIIFAVSCEKNDTSDIQDGTDTTYVGTNSDEQKDEPFKFLKDNMPITDGSTSTLPLDIAVHAAVMGITEEEASKLVTHTKTYFSLLNLANKECDLIIRTPLSESEIDTLKSKGFNYTAEPLSSEGFVFVVNASNPVDTLSADQLRDIYSGKITNWKEVGGNDLPIIPYQRNSDSGSHNYMLSFMGDTTLMEPITEPLPSTMAGILNAIASYDNGEAAIGYSVFAYSDGMYEDMAKIKYIKVNGVEPSLESIANGSYPLLGYNYAIFSSDLPENSPVRTLVSWMQSDEGQQVIANAGYVPYRNVEGLTLPDMTRSPLFTALGTGAEASDADYYYATKEHLTSTMPTIKDERIRKIISDYIADELERLNAISDSEIAEFTKSRTDLTLDQTLSWTGRRIYVRFINGYASILSGIEYSHPVQDSPYYYYKAQGAVFDIFSGERLEFTDLFPEGKDFSPELNAYLKKLSVTPYSGFGAKYDTLRDFDGLREGKFVFTADKIIFEPGDIFFDGVSLSLDKFRPNMSISQPRDMKDLFAETVDPVTETELVKEELYTYTLGEISTPVQYPNGNDSEYGINIWLLDNENGRISPKVCEKINSFVLDFYEKNLSPEALLKIAEREGFESEDVDKYYIGHLINSRYDLTLCGNRYIEFSGWNILSINLKNGSYHTIQMLKEHDKNIVLRFDIFTGELIK